jgi:hypothetical protein
MKKGINFRKIITKIHANKWIALSPKKDKVVAYDAKLIDLTKKVGNRKVVYMKVPPMDTAFAF